MSQHAKLAKRTILYIEDKPVNQVVVERILRYLGCEVLIAEHGTHGIDIALHTQPHLILLDMSLPDLSGSEVFEILQTHENTAHIPVVAVAPHTDGMPKTTYKEVGFSGYLAKPIHRGELLNAIVTILGGAIAK